MMWKDPESHREYFKSYYLAHRDELRARRKERYQLNKEAEKRANNARYRAKCMEQYNSEKG